MLSWVAKSSTHLLFLRFFLQTGILLSKPSDDKPMGSQVNVIIVSHMLLAGVVDLV